MFAALKKDWMEQEHSSRTTTATETMETMLHRWLPCIVVLLASAIAILSQYPALVNEYVINGDVPQHTYWMQQFVDEELFRDDILTDFAKSMQPYGLVFFYRLTSFVMDPLMAGKIFPIVLFVIGALYMFRIVQYLAGDLGGLFAVLLFVTMPAFLGPMVGGTARTFSCPLLIVFLYYLIKEDHTKASGFLILQAFFYPVVFLVSLVTYSLTFIKIQGLRVSLDLSRTKLLCFMIASFISVALLASNYLSINNISPGNTVVTRSQASSGGQEYSSQGRFQIVPTQSLIQSMLRISAFPFVTYVADSPLYLALLRQLKPESFTPMLGLQVMLVGIFIVTIFLINEIRKGNLVIPSELPYMLLASAIMYELADLFLFRLYLPGRYLTYSVPPIMVIVISLTIVRLISYVTHKSLKAALTVGLIALFSASFINMRGIGLNDQSKNKNLYRYLNTLPKNALIAASPYVADYIPTFSKRKVVINFELSHPWSVQYWQVIKSRTRDFFHAYYSAEHSDVVEFCKRHKIDYLVVDKRDFNPEHLAVGRIYFEPFDSEIRSYVRNRKQFALLNIPESDRSFVDGNLFVIDVNRLMGSDKGAV